MTPGRAAIPNGLSLLRIGLAAGLLPAALAGRRDLFWAGLVAGLLTDALDGFVARRLHASSDLGRRFDSIGDYVLLLALLPALVLLWPDLMRREAAWFAVAVAAYFAPTAWSLLRWGRMPGLHTWASKGLAILMAVALPWMLLGGPALPLRAGCALQVAVALEEFAILALLPGFSGSMPSVVHAWRRRANVPSNRPPRSTP